MWTLVDRISSYNISKKRLAYWLHCLWGLSLKISFNKHLLNPRNVLDTVLTLKAFMVNRMNKILALIELKKRGRMK